MKKILFIILMALPFMANAQTQPPNQTFSGLLYEFKYALRADSIMLLPRNDTIGIRPSLLAPGAIIYRIADKTFYGYDGSYWKSFASGTLRALDSLRYDPSTSIFYGRYTTGGEFAVPTGLVDSLKRRVDSISRRNDTLFFWRLSGTIPVKLTSIPIANITGLTDSLLNKPTVAAADLRYIRAQSAVQEAKDFRISGRGYAGNLSAGVPFVLSTNTRGYFAANMPGDPFTAIATFQFGNEAGLDTTGTIGFFRFANNNISITDTSNQFGFVRANSLIGQITAAGALRDEGIGQGSPSSGRPAAKIGFYSENDWLNAASVSTRIVFSTKAIATSNPAERMRITGAGNVGIGTPNPIAPLHANGTNPLALTGLQVGTAADSILVIGSQIVRKIPFSSGTTGFWSTAGNSGTSSANSFIGTTDNISLRIRTNNLLRVVIDSAFGNIAIGGTTTNRKLNVSDTSSVIYSASGSTAIPSGIISGFINTSNINGVLSGIIFSPMNSIGTGQVAYIGATSNSSGFSPDIVIGRRTGSATYAEVMRYASSGFSGIGESNPQATLDIKGQSSSTGNAMRVQNSAATSLLEVANNNTVSLKGAVVYNITVQTTNYTVLSTDYTLLTSTSGITYTLGAPVAGRMLYFKNRSGGNISVALSGGATIDGSSSTVTIAAGGYLQLQGGTATDWIKLNP